MPLDEVPVDPVPCPQGPLEIHLIAGAQGAEIGLVERLLDHIKPKPRRGNICNRQADPVVGYAVAELDIGPWRCDDEATEHGTIADLHDVGGAFDNSGKHDGIVPVGWLVVTGQIMKRRNLNEMVVVITGASAGIGKALAEQLGAAGARLVLAARRMDRLDELNRALGGGHTCIQADVSKLEDCRRLIDTAFERHGRIDTLVCNAGFGIYKWVVDTTPADTRSIFETNVFGSTDCIYFALPRMLQQERRDGWSGQIMLVSSAAGRRGFPCIGMYSATKAAQFSLAEAMRVELKPRGIAVTSVHPIHTSTEFGKVAESKGRLQMISGPMGQSVEYVARRMKQAIERPRVEVWPSRSAGWALGIGTLIPRLMDRGVAMYRKQVEKANA